MIRTNRSATTRTRPMPTTMAETQPRDVVRVGPFSIEFLCVTHSTPDCVALAIETPLGTHHPHGRLQDRSDAHRRPALPRVALCGAGRARRARALRGQHERGS